MDSSTKAGTYKRKTQRIKINCPVSIRGSLNQALGECTDVSPEGMGLMSELDMSQGQSFKMNINLSPFAPQTVVESQILWKQSLNKNGKYRYGIRFTDAEDIGLKKVCAEITTHDIQGFLKIKLPEHIKNGLKDSYVSKKLDKRQIMQLIDFTPPFLRIERMVLLGDEKNILTTRSIGMGVVSAKDTEGHYNNTIFLAMCGWLMASSASVHLASLYPDTAPQVVKADGVMPLHLPADKKELWRPSDEGTVFLVETNIIKKKMQLILTETKISFHNLLYGTIKQLKLVLTPKNSIWTAKRLPPHT